MPAIGRNSVLRGCVKNEAGGLIFDTPSYDFKTIGFSMDYVLPNLD